MALAFLLSLPAGGAVFPLAFLLPLYGYLYRRLFRRRSDIPLRRVKSLRRGFLLTAHAVLLSLGALHLAGAPEYRAIASGRPEVREKIRRIRHRPPRIDRMPSVLRLRDSLGAALGHLVPGETERAVLAALTLGDRSALPRPLQTAYRDSGTLHLTALSGFHTGLLCSLLGLLFIPLHGRYRTRLAGRMLSVALIAGYAVLTGLNASVLRAVIMIAFYRFSAAGHRHSPRGNAAAAAAGIILLLYPLELFRPGFQLSFAAVCGILFLFPAIDGALPVLLPGLFRTPVPRELPLPDEPAGQAREPGSRSRRLLKRALRGFRKTGAFLLRKTWTLLAVSTACQIATGPLVRLYFGHIPPHFLLANLAAAPLVCVILYLFGAALLLHPVPAAGPLLARLLQGALALLNAVVEYIAGP